jgi:transcriptional regulator with XRE-family HTH domain
MANDTARYPLITKPASSLAQTLATNVTTLRSKQGLNKQMFALMAGISRPMLNRIESGEADTRLSYVQRIADALGVEPTYLLTPHDAE